MLLAMNASPYRVAAESALDSVKEADDVCPDGDLLPVLALLWVGSIGRVTLGLLHAEVFGAEPTLALLTIVGVPLLLRRALRWHAERLSARLRVFGTRFGTAGRRTGAAR